MTSLYKVTLKKQYNSLLANAIQKQLFADVLQNKCFPVKCAKFLRAPIFTEQNTLGGC